MSHSPTAPTLIDAIGDSGGGRPLVVSIDPAPPTPALIAAVDEAGATLHAVPDLSHLGGLLGSKTCHVALLAAGAFDDVRQSPASAAEALRRCGFTVIAWLDNMEAVSLVERCRLLLAGCTGLINAARSDFRRELTRQLAAAIRAGKDKADEERHVLAVLRTLGIVGQSAGMLALFRDVLRLSALSDLSTIITGETGTGKELIARALHALDGKRRHGPFIALNCSAINSALAGSELFGHRRGAFTGAQHDRQGLIRAAHRGVLFLDEIGELAMPLQAQLLRVLQEGRVLAVGEDHELAVDVRIVAATNRDIASMVEEGQFRADLFHRLNVLSIHVPPLRERKDDIGALVEHFARKHGHLSAVRCDAVHPSMIDALCRLDLPGNARQLENIVRLALVRHDGTGQLDLRDLPPDVWHRVVCQDSSSTGARKPPDADEGYPARLLVANGWSLSRTLEACERQLLAVALKQSRGNQTRAARLLGITPRSVYKKLHRQRSA